MLIRPSLRFLSRRVAMTSARADQAFGSNTATENWHEYRCTAGDLAAINH